MSQAYKTKQDMVIAAVRDALDRNELQPGQRLNEKEWAARLSVSPTPVREAFRQLQAVGLVEILPQRGARIVVPTNQDRQDLVDIRGMLEPLFARYAIERSTPEQLDALIERLETVTRAMHDDLATSDIPSYRQHNREAHWLLYEACNSMPILLIMRAIWAAYPGQNAGSAPNDLPGAVAAHDSILAAVRARDPDAVEQAMAQHLRNAVMRGGSRTVHPFEGQRDGDGRTARPRSPNGRGMAPAAAASPSARTTNGAHPKAAARTRAGG
jgi:DNA-binding GntR family transcriptional regulator